MLITAPTEEKLQNGLHAVNSILNLDDEGGLGPKNNMLVQAAVNSTLGEEICENCGEKGHRKWTCPL